ncbi:MAG: hypothetical protein ACOYM3_32990, partial [Terrimicrobiaceae bacterium]
PVLAINLGISHKKGGPMTLQILGGNTDKSYSVDYSDRLVMPFAWSPLLSTQFNDVSIAFDDPTPMTNARIYRVRQP